MDGLSVDQRVGYFAARAAEDVLGGGSRDMQPFRAGGLIQSLLIGQPDCLQLIQRQRYIAGRGVGEKTPADRKLVDGSHFLRSRHHDLLLQLLVYAINCMIHLLPGVCNTSF